MVANPSVNCARYPPLQPCDVPGGYRADAMVTHGHPRRLPNSVCADPAEHIRFLNMTSAMLEYATTVPRASCMPLSAPCQRQHAASPPLELGPAAASTLPASFWAPSCIWPLHPRPRHPLQPHHHPHESPERPWPPPTHIHLSPSAAAIAAPLSALYRPTRPSVPARWPRRPERCTTRRTTVTARSKPCAVLKKMPDARVRCCPQRCAGYPDDPPCPAGPARPCAQQPLVPTFPSAPAARSQRRPRPRASGVSVTVNGVTICNNCGQSSISISSLAHNHPARPGHGHGTSSAVTLCTRCSSPLFRRAFWGIPHCKACLSKSHRHQPPPAVRMPGSQCLPIDVVRGHPATAGRRPGLVLPRLPRPRRFPGRVDAIHAVEYMTFLPNHRAMPTGCPRRECRRPGLEAAATPFPRLASMGATRNCASSRISPQFCEQQGLSATATAAGCVIPMMPMFVDRRRFSPCTAAHAQSINRHPPRVEIAPRLRPDAPSPHRVPFPVASPSRTSMSPGPTLRTFRRLPGCPQHTRGANSGSVVHVIVRCGRPSFPSACRYDLLPHRPVVVSVDVPDQPQ